MSSSEQPATFHGSGFAYRDKKWTADLGTIWKDWTVSCDGAPLKSVMLAEPASVYHAIKDLDSALLLERPDEKELHKQFLGLIEVYRSLDIEVHTCTHPQATANWIFQRDIYNSSPHGLILARPASKTRRGEEVLMFQHLAQLCAPVIHSIHGQAFFEGADLLWIDKSNALLGIGNRSTTEAYKQLQQFYPNTTFHQIILPKHIQHVLGLINFISPTCVGVWDTQCSKENYRILENLPLEILPITGEDEIRKKRAFNWVCIAPNQLLLPHDATHTIKFLMSKDIKVDTAIITEYRLCGGGLGCLTGILSRKEAI